MEIKRFPIDDNTVFLQPFFALASRDDTQITVFQRVFKMGCQKASYGSQSDECNCFDFSHMSVLQNKILDSFLFYP